MTNTNTINRVKSIWQEAKTNELEFWQKVLTEQGWLWPEDFQNRINPNLPLQEYITQYLDPKIQEPALILDAGAGPLTVLGKSWDKRQIKITAVDCLGDEYNLKLKEHEIVPLIRTEQCEVECLLQKFPTNQFDLAHIRNALDHSYDPILGLLQMIAVVKPGGYVILAHNVNEAENENYEGMHQWNFCAEHDEQNRDFVIWNRSLRIGVNQLLKSIADLESLTQQDHFVMVVFKKRNNIPTEQLDMLVDLTINMWLSWHNYCKKETIPTEGKQPVNQFQTQEEWIKLNQTKDQLESDLSQAKNTIEAMKSSKFWQLRSKWIKIKTGLGFDE